MAVHLLMSSRVAAAGGSSHCNVHRKLHGVLLFSWSYVLSPILSFLLNLCMSWWHFCASTKDLYICITMTTMHLIRVLISSTILGFSSRYNSCLITLREVFIFWMLKVWLISQFECDDHKERHGVLVCCLFNRGKDTEKDTEYLAR